MKRRRRRKERREDLCKGKNIFLLLYIYRCGCDKKKAEREREKEKKIENALHLPQKKKKESVELSKQVNTPAKIIWSDGRVLHISGARTRKHIAKKDKQHFCCRQYVLVRNAK